MAIKARMTVRLPQGWSDRLDQLAAIEDISPAELARDLLVEGLRRRLGDPAVAGAILDRAGHDAAEPRPGRTVALSAAPDAEEAVDRRLPAATQAALRAPVDVMAGAPRRGRAAHEDR